MNNNDNEWVKPTGGSTQPLKSEVQRWLGNSPGGGGGGGVKSDCYIYLS